MLQNSDVHLIFKGATGTISEFGMSWANSRIHEGHSKPILLYGDFWHHIIREFTAHMSMRPGENELLKVVTSPEEVLRFLKGL
jgi:predicted Rossmann-fold nucleotide-binding protein